MTRGRARPACRPSRSSRSVVGRWSCGCSTRSAPRGRSARACSAGRSARCWRASPGWARGAGGGRGGGEAGGAAPRATPSLSAARALETVPAGVPVLLTTADHALLRPDIVDYFCAGARAAGADVAVGLTPYELVKSAYPDPRRTAIRLRDGAVCGSNLFAFLTPASPTPVALP